VAKGGDIGDITSWSLDMHTGGFHLLHKICRYFGAIAAPGKREDAFGAIRCHPSNDAFSLSTHTSSKCICRVWAE
jgi:hypothetical protein